MKRARTARIYRGTARNLALLASRLQAGELVAVPTETVYGLAANALDPAACKDIFRAKGRPLHDPLIVHLFSADELPTVCTPSPAATRLAAAFWPGPLTLVVPKLKHVPGIVSAGRPSVAVRVPSHPLFRRLLKLSALPLAAPSANRFGYVSPTTAEHVRDGLGDKIEHILDGGPSQIGLESTIVDLRNPARPRVLRPGAITREQIASVLGCEVLTANSRRPTNSPKRGQLAPGLLTRHYSPRTRVVLHGALAEPTNPKYAYLYWRNPTRWRGPNVFWLNSAGSLRSAARHLFARLRELDRRGFEEIHVELAPETGIGIAINDRLRRAAAR